jgi:hypothetical protein
MSIIRANKFQGLDAPNPAIELPADGTVILASGFSGNLESQGSFTTNSLTVENTATVQGSLLIDGTTAVSVGASGAPAIHASGDINTGIFFPAADTTSFSQGGTERFRFGSAGQFGIGGATYGTSGQFLQSQGASAAPQWATGGGITWLATQNTTSGSAITVTGIDTNARMIVIGLYRVSQSATSANQLTLRVGNGSINSGNNYFWSVGRGVDSDSITSANNAYRLIVDAYSDASFIFSGNITLLRVQDTSNPLWSITHNLSENGGGNEPIYAAGSFTDTQIDRVQLIPAGNFDNGAFRVGYIL